MADHYRAALAALQDVNEYCDELDTLEPGEEPLDPDFLEKEHQLEHKIDVALRIANVHAILAQAQALQERALVR